LFGDPANIGFYSILLFVPAHVTLQAHAQRDNRMATVVSGGSHFGCGSHFDAEMLKTLPLATRIGSRGVEQFAPTADTAAVVHISGYGPTDMKHF